MSARIISPVDEEVRSIYLFSSLSPEQVAKVVSATREVSLEENEVLFRQGDPVLRFFWVRSGYLKLFLLSPNGQEKVLEILGPGQTFAEAVMFLEASGYPINAAALSPSEILAFDSQVFLSLLRESVETCFRVMATMSKRLRRLVKAIDELTLQNATLRLVRFLVENVSEGEPGLVTLPTTKTVLASRLSVQPETLSRIMHRLSGRGLIEVQGATIRVLQPDALADMLRADVG